MIRRAAPVLVVLVAVLFAVPSTAQEPSAATAVLVVGVPGLAWSDVTPDRMPTLHALSGTASVGSLSVRSANEEATRRFDGWATFSAGNRARAQRLPLPELVRGSGLAVRDPAVPALRADNDRLEFDAEVGALGIALRDAGRTAAALGRGAVLGLADSAGDTGLVPPAHTGSTRLAADVVVVELVVAAGPLGAQSVDRQLGELLADVPDTTVTLVVGVSDHDNPPSGLRVALASGPGFRGGLLRSASTRRDGFVQLIDVAPTVLDLLGVARPKHMVGQPWRRVEGSAAITDLVDADRAASAHRRFVPPFFTLLVALQLTVYGLAWWAFRRQPSGRTRNRVRTAMRAAALAFAAVPVSTYLVHLVPWWRHSLGWLVAAVAVIDLAVLALATLGPWRRHAFGPVATIMAITVAVLTADLVTGAHLQLSSLAGYSPVLAGRFAGVGNVAFSVYATSALLLLAALAARRTPARAVTLVAVLGAVVLVVDGSPIWGSDFGGVLAALPGFAVLGLLLSGKRVSARRAVVIAVAAIGLVLAFALLDYARAPDARSHLGRFVAQVLDGEAGTILRRKGRANLRLLTHSVFTAAVPVLVVALALRLRRPPTALQRVFDGAPAFRAGLAAVLVTAVLGALVNDSGVAILSWALLLAVPVTVAAAMADGSPDTTGASPGGP